jgi:hypothetical protein
MMFVCETVNDRVFYEITLSIPSIIILQYNCVIYEVNNKQIVQVIF